MSLFRDSSFYIVGLARTGMEAVNFLLSMQAEVFVWDDDQFALKDLPEEVSVMSPSGAFASGVYDRLNGVLLSPGIGDTHEAAEYAQRVSVPLISDISLFACACPNIHHIALTGTNGKSTVCLLLEHVLKECGINACAAGNIGIPILQEDNIAKVRDNPLFVLELSSYQIDRLYSPLGFSEDLIGSKNFNCDVAILLNIAEDHLERYHDMDSYAHAKEQLFEYLDTEGLAVVGIDDEYSVKIYDRLKAAGRKIVAISGEQCPDGGIGVRDGKLWDDIAGEEVLDLSSLPYLLGAHNVQNLAAAYACLREYKLDRKALLSAISSFIPLPHRQEFVAENAGITFINDSKATNSAAVLPAFRAFKNIYWLAGGILKEDNFSILDDDLGKLKGGYFYGLDGRTLHDSFEEKIKCHLYETLKEAFLAAYEDARKSGGESVILLSPAAASFDQFDDFAQRGEYFKDLIKETI